MRLTLQRHPANPHLAVEDITVEWSLARTGIIWLRYHAAGQVEQVRLPEVSVQPERSDNLWENTCFELFLCEPGKERYCEFNFSPSGNWAAYGFRGYRDGMKSLSLTQKPEILMDFSDSHIALEATFGLPETWLDSDLNAGLSAVIEMRDGAKSFWALAHPAASPDFHHRDGFALKMEASEL